MPDIAVPVSLGALAGLMLATIVVFCLRALAAPTPPDRLVAELRLAQMAALILTMSASAYIGFAASHEDQLGGAGVGHAVEDPGCRDLIIM